jgi:glycosyltransferase involved in cell wall biosynthesis
LSARGDLLSNDLTICVSNATRSDVLLYLDPPHQERVITIYPAHKWSAGCEAAYETLLAKAGGSGVEPFILVLGTIEPRKNIGVVLDLLRRSPGLLEDFRFVFAGREGWGEPFLAYLDRFGLTGAYRDNRILFTGYISENAKYALMRTARMVVYPSLFEGFGLPVLEALSVGAGVLTTQSSSIPEVGGEACYYFDPFDNDSFAVRFRHALSDSADPSRRAAAVARSAAFSWATFYEQMLAAIADRGGAIAI